jgi:pimeloyl-ACP methyl ester carboxylesterase
LNDTKRFDRIGKRLVLSLYMSIITAILLVCTVTCAGKPLTSGGSTPVGADEGGLAEEEVKFIDGNVELHGTLFLPASRLMCPAVVILAGSDRSGRGPLRVSLARQFAKNDIVALVYDSPGTGGSGGNARLQTREDRVEEAMSAARYLRSSRDIDAGHVGIFGGSEGADIALLAASQDPDVAFVIAVSGAIGASVFEVMGYSAEKMGYRLGLSIDEIAKAATFKEITYALLAGLDIIEWHTVEARASRWEDDRWKEFIDLARQRRETMAAQEREAYLASLRDVVQHFTTARWFGSVTGGKELQQLTSLDTEQFFTFLDNAPFTRDWERDMRCEIKKIRCPVLAIWGEEDSFLPPNRSAARLKMYLAEANHQDFSTVVLEDASHFLTVPGSKDEFAPGYLETMMSWVEHHAADR